MSRYAAWLCILFLLTACAGTTTTLPLLQPAAGEVPSCTPLFPGGNVQFVHLIEFSMPGGQQGTVMGVTVIRGGRIDATLLSVEGFVLFSGSFQESLTVSRAVPPFDRPGFAAGLLADIQALFLQPEGEVSVGRLTNGNPVCRITEAGGQVMDRLKAQGDCSRFNFYSAQHRLIRTLLARDCSATLAGRTIPKKIELHSMRMGGYSLHLSLISAEQLP